MPSNININSLSPSFRDILLGLNLQPSPTISSNNYSLYLSTHTPVGLPFTVNYGNSVTAPTQSIFQTADLIWRPTSYTLNQFQAVPLSDYADAGVVIGNTPFLPNSSGTVPYSITYANTVSYLGLTFGSTPTIYNSNSIPDDPYTSLLNNNTPYTYSVNKNFFSLANNYKEFYANYVSYLGLTFGPTPLIYNTTSVPDTPYSSILFGNTPYVYSIGKNLFDNTNGSVKNYSNTYFNLNPGFPALSETKNTEGKVYSPNLNLNLYKGSEDDIVYSPNQWLSIQGVTNQKEGYLDANGNLNIGGPSTEPYNIISSLLHGGVGFNKDGSNMNVISNNDIRNTIVGRALTATGLINDTQLGIIGSERLAISLANNSAFKLQKETIGRVNLDIFSWIDGKKDDFIVPNYEITVPAGKLGKTVDFLGDLAGFTMPRSQMKTEFFSFDDKFKPTLIGNIARANGLLETTGKGQVIALFRNLQANLSNSNFLKQGYAPGIVNKRVDGEDAILHNVYAYSNSDGEIIENNNLKLSDSSQYGNKRWTDKDGSGFEADYFNYVTYGNGGNTNGNPTESGFIWSDTKVNSDKNVPNDLIPSADSLFGPSPVDGESNSNQPNRKSILYKTKELFKNGNMSTMVNGHGIDTERSQIQSAVQQKGAGFIMSKGNAALTKAALNKDFGDYPYENVFCRTWTPMDKYDQINDLIRHRKLDKDGGTYKRRSPLSEYSVLENTGFVKIAQYVSDEGSVKRHMFSIENLAYKEIGKLPKCEQGPNGGRIMWFPPYDINFSESTSVNWDKHNFIGRGEPMYTYNNAERTGQLSFKVIIDHPNQLNVQNSNILETDEHYYSYFAGCNPLEPPPLKKVLYNEEGVVEIPTTKVVDSVKIEPTSFNIFFPNDNHEYPYNNPGYESGLADISGVGNINNIVSTVAEKERFKKIPNINNQMGYPNNGIKTLGPINPINLSSSQYDSYKITYNDYPKGLYLGLGMTKNDEKNLSLYTDKYIDTTNFGLNANRHDSGEEKGGIQNLLEIPNVGSWSGWLAGNGKGNDGTKIEMSYLDALKKHMDYKTGPCKNCIIEILGAASEQGSVDDTTAKNQKLSDRRANTIRKYLIEKLGAADPKIEDRIKVTKGSGETDKYNKFAQYKDKDGTSKPDECIDNKSNIDSLGCKLNRRVGVRFVVVPELEEKNKTIKEEPTNKVQKRVQKDLIDAVYQECNYFAKLSEKDPFTYSKITDKIKYFSPAFHSTTPEGFNSRLTFLQGCTRQGPSIYGENPEKPDNLVFGRPPVCVLRIGDFYNTKIIIENISFEYEPLVWDLNPEGIGVQPMIANVSITFAFIGGSSLDGPISKLQNGISRNYYANTGLFDTNAIDNTNTADSLSGQTITDAKYNESVIKTPDKQESFIPETDKALTSQEIDKKILEEGILSLKYDDFGIFQGKVKGTFSVKSKLSKEYTIKLRTKDYSYKVGDEPIDAQKLKLNELKVELTSKNKTTVSLQKWDYYFTDTNFMINYYILAQESLDNYVNNYMTTNNINPNDMSGNESNGWDLVKDLNTSILNYNYDFMVEVDELNFKKEYKARWVPSFKVDKNVSIINDPTDQAIWSTKYSYKAYLSGGKLFIINSDNQTSEEIAEEIKLQTENEKGINKSKNKTKKEEDKQTKANKKTAIAEQKANVLSGGGSLI